MTSETYIIRLCDISQRKYVLLNDMLALTHAQTQALAVEDVEELAKAVGEKQGKIAAIDHLDEEFDVYFQRLKTLLGVRSMDELQDTKISGVVELQAAIIRILQTIQAISEAEKSNIGQAGRLFHQYGEEIRKIHTGKKVSAAYQPIQEKTPSYFIDKKK